MQLVFLGEADGAVHLVRQPGGDGRRLPGAGLGGADHQGVQGAAQRVRRDVCGSDRRGALAGQDRPWFCWMAWNLPMGRPNCTRVCA